MGREEALRTQLSELNTRSRWYSSQIWQVPFAYVGLSALAVSSIAKNYPAGLAWAAILAGIGGLLTLIHMCAVQEGIKRAITNIQKTEETLGLEVTAKYKPVVHLTLMAVLILAVAAFITLAVQAFQSTSVSTN